MGTNRPNEKPYPHGVRRLALLLLLLVLAGCGGDGGLSRDEYAEQFRQAESRLETIENRFRTPTDRESQLRVLRTTVSELRAVGTDLAELEPPEELADEHRELVAAVRGQADAVEEVAEAFAAGKDLQKLAPEANRAVERLLDATGAVEEALAADRR